ncbi:MAG TPA: Ku protein [Solirubrobacteraceae bacterium]|nr:Ku protein [Solirubrobacteraceae bacterium]
MARSIWSGSISFGLVNVPVKLYTAVSRKAVHFHQLDESDQSRIRQKRVRESDGEEVPYENIVKGYEVSPDRYVVIEPAELEALDPKKTKMIEIEQFVDLAEIDPILYDQPYYVVPATGAAKAYRLMVDAMRDSGRVGIARVVLRQKEHLVALRPKGEVLLMETLIFADEVVSPDTLDEVAASTEAEVTDRELNVARQLIEMLSGPFDPEQYRDEYREAVLALIEAKVAGEEISLAPAASAEPAVVPDLMAALQASVEAAGRYGERFDGDGNKKPAAKPRAAAKPKASPRKKAASTAAPRKRQTTKKS